MLAMVSEQMNPHALVGWVVREGIMRQGMKYTQTARAWHVSLPTLNRLMAGQPVSLMFYRVAERELDLPWNLLDHILDGDADAVRQAPATRGLDESLREHILSEMDRGKPPRKRTTRRA